MPPAREAQPFPIVECFGFDSESKTPEALAARAGKLCPFAQNTCEKYRQYGFGYCSVTYSAADDGGVRNTYAVCDHRVDGTPLERAIKDHFGDRPFELVPEVVLSDPRTSFDYVAFSRDGRGEVSDLIAIETQAIDIRGGGVGPAWRAWMADETHLWREYFSEEAATKGRKDTVAYGVNMANIYKRLGLQVATKGSLLKAIGIPFYVVMQDRPFRYLKRRINFSEVEPGETWDVSFVTSDYTGQILSSGEREFAHVGVTRTTLANYTAALSADSRATADQRAHFINRVMLKARQAQAGADVAIAGGRTHPLDDE